MVILYSNYILYMVIIYTSILYHLYRHSNDTQHYYYYIAVFWWKTFSVWVKSHRVRSRPLKWNLLAGPCFSFLLPSPGQEANRQSIKPTGNRGSSLKAEMRTKSILKHSCPYVTLPYASYVLWWLSGPCLLGVFKGCLLHLQTIRGLAFGKQERHPFKRLETSLF